MTEARYPEKLCARVRTSWRKASIQCTMSDPNGPWLLLTSPIGALFNGPICNELSVRPPYHHWKGTALLARMPLGDVRWRADHDKGVLLANFARRGWTRASVCA